jgi:FixJ family two-component response regulator
LPAPAMISVIDDDASIRIATDNLLRSLGYVVLTFESAEEFLRSDSLDDTSCVIADVNMPAISGVELLALLRTQGKRVPFIFITAFPDERVRATALAAGAIGFLTKPFDRGNFIRCIELALRPDGGSAGH